MADMNQRLDELIGIVSRSSLLAGLVITTVRAIAAALKRQDVVVDEAQLTRDALREAGVTVDQADRMIADLRRLTETPAFPPVPTDDVPDPSGPDR